MPKVLILSSKTGGGHVSLAEALRDQLAHDFAVEIVDPQPRVVHWHYRLVSRHALWLWAAEFKRRDRPVAHCLYTKCPLPSSLQTSPACFAARSPIWSSAPTLF